MNIITRISPNQNKGRQGWTPDIIACHITEGSFDGTVSWITDPASGVSYHYVVSQDGRIVQAVDIANTAWANGTTSGMASNSNKYSRIAAVRDRNVNANLYTISIGFEGRLSEKQGDLTAVQLMAGVTLIAFIRNEVKRLFGITIPITRENIVGHADITPQWKPNCPGPAFPFEEIIKQLKSLETTEPDGEIMGFNINGKIVNIPAFIRNDRTYVQARMLVEAMGYAVEWDECTRTVVVKKP